nr:12471_t:CDS:2 [Entrophospora candida]
MEENITINPKLLDKKQKKSVLKPNKKNGFKSKFLGFLALSNLPAVTSFHLNQCNNLNVYQYKGLDENGSFILYQAESLEEPLLNGPVFKILREFEKDILDKKKADYNITGDIDDYLTECKKSKDLADQNNLKNILAEKDLENKTDCAKSTPAPEYTKLLDWVKKQFVLYREEILATHEVEINKLELKVMKKDSIIGDLEEIIKERKIEIKNRDEQETLITELRAELENQKKNSSTSKISLPSLGMGGLLSLAGKKFYDKLNNPSRVEELEAEIRRLWERLAEHDNHVCDCGVDHQQLKIDHETQVVNEIITQQNLSIPHGSKLKTLNSEIKSKYNSHAKLERVFQDELGFDSQATDLQEQVRIKTKGFKLSDIPNDKSLKDLIKNVPTDLQNEISTLKVQLTVKEKEIVKFIHDELKLGLVAGSINKTEVLNKIKQLIEKGDGSNAYKQEVEHLRKEVENMKKQPDKVVKEVVIEGVKNDAQTQENYGFTFTNEEKNKITLAPTARAALGIANQVVKERIQNLQSSRSSDKYEYNPITKKLELDRVLSVAMHYPEKYGFIPKTLAPDGDELDFICLTERAGGAGEYIKARIIGVLRMNDNGEQDDKLLVVDNGEPELNYIKSLEEIPEKRKKKIIHFFSHYKDLENKKVEVGNFEGKEEAEKLLKVCQKTYQNKMKGS